MWVDWFERIISSWLARLRGGYLGTLDAGDNDGAEVAGSCGSQQQLLIEADAPSHEGATDHCSRRSQSTFGMSLWL